MQGRPTSAPTPFCGPALHGIEPGTLGETHLYLWFGTMLLYFYAFVKTLCLVFLYETPPWF